MTTSPTLPLDVVLMLAEEALGSAQNGLRWYQEAHPDDGGPVDDEMHEQIDAATLEISNARAALASSAAEPRHVGDSRFESWYESHPKAIGGDKQLARDAYAAGMSEAPHPVSAAEPSQPDERDVALSKIAEWSSHTSEFAVDYGSNGVRDFYRKIARAALQSRQPAAPVAAVPEFEAETCSPDVFKHGVSVGLFDIPKQTANALCQSLTASTGLQHDWHYIAGRVHVKVLASPTPPVQRDADRYRWIAAHCRSTPEHWGGRWSIVVDGPAPKTQDSEDDFDAAIDAAIAARAAQAEGER